MHLKKHIFNRFQSVDNKQKKTISSQKSIEYN